MQNEMEAGGTGLFFDLFVALVNHLVGHLSQLHAKLTITGRCDSRQISSLIAKHHMLSRSPLLVVVSYFNSHI